jgi:hypothetical protein
MKQKKLVIIVMALEETTTLRKNILNFIQINIL